MAGKRSSRASLRQLHRWIGLVVMLWLLVLGLTGWALAHREARWIQQSTVPEWMVSERMQRLSQNGPIRFLAALPDGRMLGGSYRGLWTTGDRGEHWNAVKWEGLEASPQVFGMSNQPGGPFLATDDGIWKFDPQHDRAERVALAGEHVNSLSAGTDDGPSFALVDRTKILRIDLGSGAYTGLTIERVDGTPSHVTVTRVARELHEGKGTFAKPWGIWINDFGGIALAVLALSGLAMWLISKRRFRSPSLKRNAFTSSYKLHAPIVGLIAAVPVLYLCLTGLYLNTGWLEHTGTEAYLKTASLPPAYSQQDLSGELTEIAASPADPQVFWVLGRFGVLQTRDGGRSFSLVESLPRDVGQDGRRFSLLRSESDVYVAVGGVGVFRNSGPKSSWEEIAFAKPPSHLTSITAQGQSTYFKDSGALYVSDAGAPPVETKLKFLRLEGVPMLFFLLDLHLGFTGFGALSYLNDAAALGGLFLAITGVILWLRRPGRKSKRSRRFKPSQSV